MEDEAQCSHNKAPKTYRDKDNQFSLILCIQILAISAQKDIAKASILLASRSWKEQELYIMPRWGVMHNALQPIASKTIPNSQPRLVEVFVASRDDGFFRKARCALKLSLQSNVLVMDPKMLRGLEMRTTSKKKAIGGRKIDRMRHHATLPAAENVTSYIDAKHAVNRIFFCRLGARTDLCLTRKVDPFGIDLPPRLFEGVPKSCLTMCCGATTLLLSTLLV